MFAKSEHLPLAGQAVDERRARALLEPHDVLRGARGRAPTGTWAWRDARRIARGSPPPARSVHLVLLAALVVVGHLLAADEDVERSRRRPATLTPRSAALARSMCDAELGLADDEVGVGVDDARHLRAASRGARRSTSRAGRGRGRRSRTGSRRCCRRRTRRRGCTCVRRSSRVVLRQDLPADLVHDRELVELRAASTGRELHVDRPEVLRVLRVVADRQRACGARRPARGLARDRLDDRPRRLEARALRRAHAAPRTATRRRRAGSSCWRSRRAGSVARNVSGHDRDDHASGGASAPVEERAGSGARSSA